MRCLPLVASFLTLSACFRYVPVTRQSPAVGTQIRIELSDRGTVDVQPTLGERVMTVDGTVRAADANGVTVALSSVQRGGFGAQSWAGEIVTLKPEDIRSVSERRLSHGRTAAAATGAITVAAAGILAVAKATGEASGQPGTKPPPVTP